MKDVTGNMVFSIMCGYPSMNIMQLSLSEDMDYTVEMNVGSDETVRFEMKLGVEGNKWRKKDRCG